MKFLKYTAYYIYNYFIQRGRSFENAKLRSTGYITASLFFYFISFLLPLRFLNINFSAYPEWIIKGSIIIFGVSLYLIIYLNIERESKFVKIINDFKEEEQSPYSVFSVWMFVFGGIILFVLVFLSYLFC